MLAANFKRIAEALRTLEEYSKLLDVWLAGRYEVLRYDVYTIEKLIMTAVVRPSEPGRCTLMVLVGGLTRWAISPGSWAKPWPAVPM